MASPPPMLAAAAAFLTLLSFLSTPTSSSSPSPPAAIDQVCGRLGGYYVTPTLCISTLCSSPSSPCHTLPDAPSVATLAAHLAAGNATAAMDSIQATLTSSPPSPPASGPANTTSSAAAAANAASAASAAAARSACLELYAGAVPALRWAAKAVAEGRYCGAREVLQAAQYVAAGCEGMAGDAAAVIPRENGRFGDLAFVAHAVVASMAAD